MPRHLLTDAACRNAKPKAKRYRLSDGDGLFLSVTPNGARSWHYRYRDADGSQTAMLGKYPAIGLTDARRLRDVRAKQASEGEHLTVVKRAERTKAAAAKAATLRSVAEDWQKVERRRVPWKPGHAAAVRSSIDRHLASLLDLPVVKVDARLAAAAMKPLLKASPDMAEKVRQRLRAVLDYAVEQGLISFNPLPNARRRKAGERKHLPAITDRAGVGSMLRDARGREACRGVKRAHEIVAFTAQRISEVVGAEWVEFDLEAGLWSIPRARMKVDDAKRGPHVVPLPPALLANLRAWHQEDGGVGFVFPAPRGEGHITAEAVEKFYRRKLALAGKHSPHSWRTVFKTWASDGGHAFDVIESHLDHALIGGKVASAYDAAKRIEPRRKLLAWYEGQLIAARDGAEVVPLRSAR